MARFTLSGRNRFSQFFFSNNSKEIDRINVTLFDFREQRNAPSGRRLTLKNKFNLIDMEFRRKIDFSHFHLCTFRGIRRMINFYSFFFCLPSERIEHTEVWNCWPVLFSIYWKYEEKRHSKIADLKWRKNDKIFANVLFKWFMFCNWTE